MLAFLSVEGICRAMGEERRDPLRPQFTDHCFTGDYPTPLTDRADTAVRKLHTASPAPAICKIDPKKATDAQMKAVTDRVFDEFKAAGADDRTAKGYRFTDQLQADWKPAATKI